MAVPGQVMMMILCGLSWKPQSMRLMRQPGISGDLVTAKGGSPTAFSRSTDMFQTYGNPSKTKGCSGARCRVESSRNDLAWLAG